MSIIHTLGDELPELGHRRLDDYAFVNARRVVIRSNGIAWWLERKRDFVTVSVPAQETYRER